MESDSAEATDPPQGSLGDDSSVLVQETPHVPTVVVL
jgi:hypothetical protein